MKYMNDALSEKLVILCIDDTKINYHSQTTTLTTKAWLKQNSFYPKLQLSDTKRPEWTW